MKKIKKHEISLPTPLKPKSMDSGIHINSNPIVPAHGNNTCVPFAAGRHDVSVSVVGTPLDPRISNPQPHKELTLLQLQNFVHAFQAYKTQIHALSQATQKFVSQLQEFSDCVPMANITDELQVSDLDFLIDSSQLLSNVHQHWSSLLEKEVEEPLLHIVSSIPSLAKKRKEENKEQIQKLIQQLHKEEDSSYKLKKKRDVSYLQKSLELRMSYADEIKRLSVENECIQDMLAQQNVPLLMELLQKTVSTKLESLETIQEGCLKIGNRMHVKRRSSIFSTPTIYSAPKTEITPDNVEFLRKALENF